MAVKIAARQTNPLQGRGLELYKWTEISDGDTITPLVIPGHFSDVTVYFLKGSAFGGNIGLTGSPDPAATAGTFVALKAAEDGTAISGKTADGVFQVLNGAVAYAPTAGTSSVNVNVWLLFKSTR